MPEKFEQFAIVELMGRVVVAGLRPKPIDVWKLNLPQLSAGIRLSDDDDDDTGPGDGRDG